MNQSLRKLISILLVVCACFVFSVGCYLFIPQVTQKDGVTYQLNAGTSKKTFIKELGEQKIISYPAVLGWYIRLHIFTHLKAGEYFFPQWSSPYSIWRQVSRGSGMRQHAFTIIPGWSLKQLRAALLALPDVNHLSSGMTDSDIMLFLGDSKTAAEGRFYPETYFYTSGVTDLVILKRAYNLMQERLDALWVKRAPNLPYQNAYEALIAASLVEKEAYLDNERAVIAGVLVNRLKENMPLQFDPTVIYGMGDKYTGKIYREDLTEDTPYNTYIHRGLPPTPIAMPSYESLEAALHPAQHDYLYFVAKGDGSHQFSTSLLDHNHAVATAKVHSNGYYNDDKLQAMVNAELLPRWEHLLVTPHLLSASDQSSLLANQFVSHKMVLR